MEDTRHVALVDSLERQGSNQSGADTATVLSGENLNRILVLLVGLLRPIKDLTQSLSTTFLEVRVLVEHGTISTNVARLVVLLLANSSNTASRKTGSSCTNELGSSTDELKLGLCALQVQLLGEKIVCLGQVLPRVPKNSKLVMLVVSKVSNILLDSR